jgi:hypothetical protein
MNLHTHTHTKQRSTAVSDTKRNAETRSDSTGLLATLASPLRVPGRGAPSCGLCAALLALAACLLLAAPAGAVQLEDFDVTFAGPKGETAMAAGAHPYSMTTSFDVARREEGGKVYPVEAVRDLRIDLPVGFTGIPVATERCTAAEFLNEELGASGPLAGCRDSSAVGTVVAEVGEAGTLVRFASAVYNMQASPGYASKLGFRLGGVYLTVDLGLSESRPYRLVATLRNITQVLEFFHSSLTVWGTPSDEAHDPLRGKCVKVSTSGSQPESGGFCPTEGEAAFLVNPRACAGPLDTLWQTISWQNPAAPPASGSTLTHGAGGGRRGFSGCGELPFAPSISAKPTSRAASSPSGLDFSLDVPNPGLTNPAGRAAADIEKTVVTLPEGMTINPSQAEGLEVCTEADVARETSTSAPGEGCPQASKIGTIEVETPLLPEELFKGSLFVAEPYHNPFGTLVALYVVIKEPSLGIKIVQPLKVVPDPDTGQLVSTAPDMPQLPFSHFRLHFREGGRAPLISPPGCGSFDTTATLYPYGGGSPATSTSTFELISGPDNSPCPQGKAPFEPGFEAGTLNNAAGGYSPFAMQITRGDGMQDLSRFSAVLPPGVVGKIAAIPWCPEAGVAQARARSGEHGGEAERSDPSCPAASALGRTTAGAGVGSQLTYVPGTLYLAGPYKGAPLSVVSITPAVAGPFDAGVVVVRVGLDLNPVTGVVEADGSRSDPIPHILQGIPLSVRDLRVLTDRPEFTLNATSCAPSNAFATLWGAGTVIDPSFETPVARAARYQAAGCASLGFEPKLGIKLKGGVKRGRFPALRAHYRPKAGEANLKRLALTFPTSAFIEQGHFRTICTRVQFAAGSGHGSLCPKGARYGTARVWTPLLDGPLRGPVYLRSSDHNLPDAVFALTGPPSAPIQIEVSVRIDSVKGRLRATVEDAPDAPVSRAIVDMQGGQKGLFVNSRHLCHKPGRNRVRANLRGQNGARSLTKPRAVAVKCAKRRKAKRARAKRSAGHVSRASAVR